MGESPPERGSTSSVPETPNTVTQLSDTSNPRRSDKLGNPECARSAKQNVYFPGWPIVAISAVPGFAPATFRITKLTARPMQAFARLPGPSTLLSAFMPKASTAGPCTQTATVGVPVVLKTPRRLNASSVQASAALRTTGSASGRQPENAVVGNRLQGKLPHQRHQASERLCRRPSPRQHRLVAGQGRRYQRQPITEFECFQLRLRRLPWHIFWQ